jgi:uncharacterized protein (TIGR03083 family)
VTPPHHGELYRATRRRVMALVDGADETVSVPATPAWTVHDVVAHLAGIVEDAAAGNVAGAPGEAWTAAQVARGRDVPFDELLERWDRTAAAVVDGSATLPTNLLVDLASHEQDLRAALGRPGARDEPIIATFAPALAAGVPDRVAAAGLPPLRVQVGGCSFGPEDAPVTLATTRWEVFRLVLGRRSTRQITAAVGGADDPAAYVPHVVVFGPAAVDVVE